MPTAPFTMLATILEANPYLGRLLTGRIQTGTVKVNMPVKAHDPRRATDRARPHHQNSDLPRSGARAGR